jgi:hypothetical protein
LAGEPNDTATRTLFETSFGLSGIRFRGVQPRDPRPRPRRAAFRREPLVAFMSRGKFPPSYGSSRPIRTRRCSRRPSSSRTTISPTRSRSSRRATSRNTSTGASQVTTTSQESEDAGIHARHHANHLLTERFFLELTLTCPHSRGKERPRFCLRRRSTTVTSAVTIPDGQIFVMRRPDPGEQIKSRLESADHRRHPAHRDAVPFGEHIEVTLEPLISSCAPTS